MGLGEGHGAQETQVQVAGPDRREEGLRIEAQL